MRQSPRYCFGRHGLSSAHVPSGADSGVLTWPGRKGKARRKPRQVTITSSHRWQDKPWRAMNCTLPVGVLIIAMPDRVQRTFECGQGSMLVLSCLRSRLVDLLGITMRGLTVSSGIIFEYGEFLKL